MSYYVPPTPPMVRFLKNLARDRVYPELGATPDERVERVTHLVEHQTLDKQGVSRLLDELKAAPTDDRSLPIGVYQRDGVIYVVKYNQAKTSKYSKRLVELNGGRRLNAEDEHVPIDFEYAPEALRLLTPEDQLSLEEAKPFIIRYGRCLFCGHFLKAARSVERSVGPVCIKRYAAANGLEEAPPELSEESRAQLGGLLDQLRALA